MDGFMPANLTCFIRCAHVAAIQNHQCPDAQRQANQIARRNQHSQHAAKHDCAPPLQLHQLQSRVNDPTAQRHRQLGEPDKHIVSRIEGGDDASHYH